jgi:hypothetical protein
MTDQRDPRQDEPPEDKAEDLAVPPDDAGTVKGGETDTATLATNVANTRHEMLKGVAQNLRG